MQFAEGIPALLHKANVHQKIILQQISNLAKGFLPIPALAFDKGHKTTGLINHNSGMVFLLLQIFIQATSLLWDFSKNLVLKRFLGNSWYSWAIVFSDLHQLVLSGAILLWIEAFQNITEHCNVRCQQQNSLVAWLYCGHRLRAWDNLKRLSTFPFCCRYHSAGITALFLSNGSLRDCSWHFQQLCFSN